MQMFGSVVMEMEHSDFEHILESVKETKGAKYDTDIDRGRFEKSG